MSIKQPRELVDEALSNVNTISPEQALKLTNENKCNLIDIRDALELQKLGKIENSFHISQIKNLMLLLLNMHIIILILINLILIVFYIGKLAHNKLLLVHQNVGLRFLN